MATAPLPRLDGFAIAPMQVADAHDWAAYAVHPEVMRHTSSTAASAADLVPMIERSVATGADAPVLFSVRDAASGHFVASVGFHTVSSLNRTAEITYTVHPDRWGRGLATALCGTAVQWGLAQRGWVRIQATTLPEHLASQKVLLRCGFEQEGLLRNLRIVRGVPRDYLLFARIPARATPT